MQLLLTGPAQRSLHISRPSRLSAPLQRAVASRRPLLMATKATAAVEAHCFAQRARAAAPFAEAAPGAVPVDLVSKAQLSEWLGSQSEGVRAWVQATQFKAADGDVCLVPSAAGGIERVVAGADNEPSLWTFAALSSKLPAGSYVLREARGLSVDAAALGWALGSYAFERYKSKKVDAAASAPAKALLQWPSGCNRATVAALAEAIFFTRDLVTTPAEDMAPQHIAKEAVELAQLHGGSASVIAGDDLLSANYPAIHTVGRASSNPPQLVDIRWAPAGADASKLPRVTLVGKGVSFDTGGLDIKPAAAMKLMKKDMGGAALVLGLAHAIMQTKLPINLRVLVPTVENSVSGNAFRPLDVLQTRAGITVENGNTDAEGRLILCDALAEADSEQPDLLLDAATLTGAARVALGTELPALFATDDAAAAALLEAGAAVGDPLWRLPLHAPYRKMLDSKVADILSCGDGGYAGAITAALFLQEFVKRSANWMHIDTMAYNTGSKPGRPEGGEAFALRALFEFLRQRYTA